MWGDISLWFWFAFSWWMVIFRIFSGVCWSSIRLLWKNIYSGLLPFLNQFICFWCWVLCIFWILSTLSDILLTNIFFHLIGRLFILLSFPCCAKLFSVVPLLYICFHFLAWGQRSKKILLRPMSVLLVFFQFYSFTSYV